MRLWRLPQELGSPLRVLEQNLHTGVPVDVAGEAKIPCWSHFHVPSIFSASWGGGQNVETVAPEKVALKSLGDLSLNKGSGWCRQIGTTFA